MLRSDILWLGGDISERDHHTVPLLPQERTWVFPPLDTNLKFFHEFLNFHQSKEDLGHFERLSYISAILSNRQHWICRAVARNTISKQTHETYRHLDIKKSRLYLLKMAFGCKTLWTLWKLRKSLKNLISMLTGEKLTFFLVVVMADWFVDPKNLLGSLGGSKNALGVHRGASLIRNADAG